MILLMSCSALAQVRSVMVDTNGTLTSPTNFFAANSNAFNGLISQIGPGNGMVSSGGLLHFATSSPFTVGRVFYATGTNTIGSSAGMMFFPNQGTLELSGTLGANAVSAQDGLFQNSLAVDSIPVALVTEAINTSGSLTGGGDLSANRTLSLVNDNAAPGNNVAYRTDGSGIKGWGTIDTAALGSGTLAAARLPALTGDVTTPGGSVATTIAAGAVVDSKVAAGAAIAKSKISTSGTWADTDIPSTISRTTGTEALQNKTIASTADGGNNTVKLKSFVVLAFPHTCDGAGAILQTNDNTVKFYGQAAFSGTAAATANFVEYRLTVPEDIDTAVDLKVERFKFRLGAADTGAQSYVITMASVADSASFDSPSLGSSVNLSFAGDGAGASGDVETISNVTLTGWRSALTAGQLWVIRLARNGDTDASTQVSYSGPLVISYGSTQ